MVLECGPSSLLSEEKSTILMLFLLFLKVYIILI